MARRTKQEADETREALLNAAEQVFLERGVARASLDEVARVAGCSRGAVHWHFGDKLGLFLALDERLLLFQDEACQAMFGGSGCQTLADLANALVTSLKRLEQDASRCRLLTVMLQRCEYVDEMAPALERRKQADLRWRKALCECFKQAGARGELSGEWPPEQLALFLHALLTGLVTEWLRGEAGFSLSDEAANTLRLFFACIGKAKPAAVTANVTNA
ncbi:TetR family transcriptional regulator [Roseomonas marmotae]|uniref:TetR family transcriptional regulator n=2 Tax=Roseomonas marmotae TaxID=2768161 RepID=A0ABS3K906_9PROT|nr:TetR family transcriptional regulator [Roseomonas marmotae]MBO1073951.1 TetR family transcriptional regulator [Roseomonas marmotae]QTI80993.1 TetR family transcriptional regulator [Roseomonas marmotae]